MVSPPSHGARGVFAGVFSSHPATQPRCNHSLRQLPPGLLLWQPSRACAQAVELLSDKDVRSREERGSCGLLSACSFLLGHQTGEGEGGRALLVLLDLKTAQ